MNIDDKTRNVIVSEIDYVAKKMQSSTSAEEKVYYFSALHGVVNRVFNLEYDADLVYAHFVLLNTFTAFQQRLFALTKGGDSVIPLTEEQFDKLEKTTKELGKKIKRKEEIDSVLKEFVILAYTTTGNGYYLLDKGIIKI